MSLRASVLVLLLTLVMECCGCGQGGGDTVHLAGKVTLDGKPLPAGARASITFRPNDPKVKAVTMPIVDGKYDSPQTPKGAFKASFEINVPTGKKLMSDRTGEQYDETQNVVPPKYQQGIELNVTDDNLAHDFNLEGGLE